MLKFEQGEEGIETIEQHSGSSSCVDHLPDRLDTAAVVVHFDMTELSEEILERVLRETVVVLGVRMITVEESCGGDAHPARLEDMKDSIEGALRVVQVLENLDGNDRIERIRFPLE